MFTSIFRICPVAQRLAAVAVAGLVLLPLASHHAGCTSSKSSSATNEAVEPRAFPAPEAAVDALIAALRAGDQAGLRTILGSDADELLSSGDPVADTNARIEFLRLYDERHQLNPGKDGEMVLSVGNTDWPLHIPIVQDEAGWTFDTAAGKDEMLSRRIGRNELDAIQVCLAVVDAEREFAAKDLDGNGWREYAKQFKSDPDRKNGLYWPAKPGEPESPLGVFAARASGEGYHAGTSDQPQPYHGYYYRILTQQGPAAPGGAMSFIAKGHMIGGFGVVAWPAEYANSGLKTFITSHHGVVYERDLGDDTDRIARSMTAFDPAPGWNPVSDANTPPPPGATP